MKSKKILALFSGGLCFFLLTMETPAEIRYTHHDFDYWSFLFPDSNLNREICVFCHTPHNAMTGGDASAAPLWNHTITSAGYSVYSSPTFNAAAMAPTGLSKLCLSCHDGTIAIDSHSGRVGTVMLGPPGSGFGHEGGLIGTDLMDDHPISFPYDATLAVSDGGLHDPSMTPSGLPAGGTIAEDMLFEGRLECTTCHDVHVRRSGSSPPCWSCHVVDGQWHTPPLQTLSLRKDNGGSALCLTCHKK